MEKRISFEKYRAIDLGILAVILVVTQTLITLAVHHWFQLGQYVVSPVAIVVALVLMRWGPWAAIHAAVGGVLYSLLSGGQWQHHILYGAGNLLSLAALLWFLVLPKEKTRNSAFLSVCFGLLVQVLMLVGRAGMALIFGYSLPQSLTLITTELLSILFTALGIWVARKADGLFEDQKHYLLRIQDENK